MCSAGQNPVKADWIKLHPTKTARRSHHWLTQCASATLMSTIVPARIRIAFSIFIITSSMIWSRESVKGYTRGKAILFWSYDNEPIGSFLARRKRVCYELLHAVGAFKENMIVRTHIRVMKNLGAILLCGYGLIATPFLSYAQGLMPGGSAAPGSFNPHVRKLLGEITAFTCRLEQRILDKSQKETMSSSMNFALLDGKARMEIDMTTIKTDKSPADMAAMVKQMGMDQIISISLPEKKSVLQIYPNLKSFVEMPLPPESNDVPGKEPKIQKTELGKETIDGHPCVKNKVVITEESGRKFEALVWNATDMKNFPVQMQFADKGNTSIFTYKDVKLERPSASLFEAPSDFTRHQNLQAMIMQKMMQNQGGGMPSMPGGKE